MRRMGELYNNWGKYEKAEECLRQALGIVEAASLTGHAEAALEYFELGRCLYNQRKYEDAQVAFSTTLDIETNTVGRDHPNTAWTLSYLSDCYQASRNYEKALCLLQETLKIRKNKYGDNHEKTLSKSTHSFATDNDPTQPLLYVNSHILVFLLSQFVFYLFNSILTTVFCLQLSEGWVNCITNGANMKRLRNVSERP
jgi:Tfp pilus assembly protein PilF